MVMSIFVWVYFVSFMREHVAPADMLMQEYGRLSVAEQQDVFRQIQVAQALV